ncbi:MAG: tetratricopeptide repeat protein [Opitutaceae bacterium]|nr:tetratricopeptide repeat protein [Opitutaceae bacterium]
MTLSSPSTSSDPAWPGWRMAVGIGLLLAAVYVRVLHGGFVWDDNAHVTRESLRSLHGLWRIWFDLEATQQYYPLLHTAFWFEHVLWGDATVGYHVVNLVCHGAAAWLFGLTLHRLGVAGAVWGTLIFALHPVHVESVAWISEQKNTLSTVLYLGSALVYLRFDATRRLTVYFLALGLFILALLTKTVTATLPAALLVVFWWRRGRLNWRADVWPLLPWFVVGAAAGLFTAWVERAIIGAEGAEYAFRFTERLVLAGRVVWFYFAKLVWPAELIFIYPRWTISSSSLVQWVPLVAAVVVVWILFRLRVRARGPLAATLFFGGTLFPVLGFLNVYPFRYSFVADHFQYVASFGIIALAAAGAHGFSRSFRRLGAVIPAGFVAALAIVSWTQAGLYRDQETLWRATIARNPDGHLAWLNLGAHLVNVGRYGEACPLLERALALKPDSGQAYHNLGIIEMVAGRFVSALPLLERAVALDPKSAEAQDNLGHVLRQSGRIAESINHHREALRLEPGYPVAANNLGCALLDAGRPVEAVPQFEIALQRAPKKDEIHHNLGNALRMLGRTEEAIAQYEQALRLNPNLPETHAQLADVLVSARRTAEAVSHYERALALKPNDPSVRLRFGLALGQAGRLPDALAQFEAVLRVAPNDATAELNRGIALTGLNRWPEARLSFARAVELQPDSAAAHRNLAMALANTGALAESATHFQAALKLQPDSAETHSALSRVLQLLGRSREAEVHRVRADELTKAPR